MSSSVNNGWQQEFGLGRADASVFYTDKSQLNASGPAASQAHIMRRAFDLLKLDGILCTENALLVYFKQVRQVDATRVISLHRKFWNHGGAPILVLIAPDQVHIYSGLTPPASHTDLASRIPALVEVIDRTSAAILEFLPSVQSGEYFRLHKSFFDPKQRVDQTLLDNLQATRDQILASSNEQLNPKILNALLCRLVFACYLFDRKVVGQGYLDTLGLPDISHLRDVLHLQPRTAAKQSLYALFKQLGEDFNGDLFSDNLDAEAESFDASFIAPLDDFFRGTDVVTGQGSFWPYDFSAIPVEAISAIYERLLQDADKSEGAFYTPRFLAEVVLDVALMPFTSLLERRFLDPACGSGIFLVGLFNRIAEEWRQQNPEAKNDRRARELRKILCDKLYGIDINPTACRITAFSLYLAYLDQLSPRDIQELQEKGYKLPALVHFPDRPAEKVEGNIWCDDFFLENREFPVDVDLVVGNPPWGSSAKKGTSAAAWCASPANHCLIPDKQIAAAFVWKAATHTGDDGRVCLVLPHGTIFNHSNTAREFQRQLFTRYAIDHILNLVDYQFFLFAEAKHPAIVLAYKKEPPENQQHTIEYWAPKADRLVMQAEIITVPPEDRCRLKVGEVLLDLQGKDAPQIWKQRFWASARDRRLVDRLSSYPRLRDYVRTPKEKKSAKPWLMAEGMQPVGRGDDPAAAKTIRLPSKLFIKATSAKLDLFILPDDCAELPAAEFTVRSGSNTETRIFHAPHVLVAQGFKRIAFTDFDVSFQHALRGISGPEKDRALLIFLAAYLRSSLAKYFLFQTSSNWGVSRQRILAKELLRAPFAWPDDLPDSQRAWQIVGEVAGIVDEAMTNANDVLTNRKELVRGADRAIEPLISEYFDVLPLEKTLIDDTLRVIIPSIRPTRKRRIVPTILPSKPEERDDYTQRLCDTLNGWSQSGRFVVRGQTMASEALGIGVAILQKTLSDQPQAQIEDHRPLLTSFERLRRMTSQKLNTFELLRGTKVFDHDLLYLVKPITRRFWTQTAALNDADEIAGTLLMYVPQEVT